MTRIIILAVLGLALIATWALLLIAADRVHSTPTTVAGAVLGVGMTLVGQAVARRIR